MKRSLLVFCMFLQLPLLKAQTDTLFWFAAPEVASSNQTFDLPILLRISTLNQPATVTISQPANGGFTPIVVNVAANTTHTEDLSPFLNSIENKPPDVVNNYGLKISSTAMVSAYYEVASLQCQCNPEIFALKGQNALGTSFYTPFQNQWNIGAYSPTPYSAFDIVATENNTVVTITPSNNATGGHPPNVTYTVNLNAGQTYSCASPTMNQVTGSLTGSKVVSTKPVAITIKEDLLLGPNGCADLAGDQIVPVSLIGTEYIVNQGMMNTNNDGVYVVAAYNNTDIFVNGNVNPVATIQAGQTFFVLVNNSVYIQTSQPAYAYHLTGFGCEWGSAILPPVTCTGSAQVGFTRSTTELFALNIIVKNGHQGDFTLNGNAALVPAASFTAVPGTGGNWLAAQLQFNTTDVPVGAASLLSNSTDLFHMGIIHGGASSGCRYGYFSNFNSITLNLVDKVSICPGQSYTIDAGAADSYVWNTGATTQSITVSDSGSYWVDVTRQNCHGSDTVHLSHFKEPIVNLGNDSNYCNGPVLLDAGNPGSAYLWNTGDTTRTLNVVKSGIYSVKVDNGFCSKEGKVAITITDYKVFPTIPNIFTPNGDGKNDVLDLGTFAAEEYSIKIYNRWGQLVFESADENQNWDGKVKGKEAPPATYYVILRYQSFCNKNEMVEEKGFVTLLR